MAVDGLDRVHEEGQETQVLLGRLRGPQQVHARVRGQAPVVVLAAAVHARVRFLMQQHSEVVVPGDLLHEVHQEHVVVHREVGLLEHGGTFELVGGHLVVAGLDGDAQLEGLGLEVAHEGMHAVRDGTEVMVLQLLTLGRSMAEERPPGHHDVRPGVVKGLVNEEVLLFPTQRGHHFAHFLVEVAGHFGRRLVHCMQRPQQRHLVVQRLAGVADEDGGDAQGAPHDEGRGTGIPSRIATGLERVADAPAWEAGGVGLLLHQHAAIEALDAAATPDGLEEGIVLLGAEAGERLEPVRVMGGPLAGGPLLHATGDLVGQLAVDACPVMHGLPHGVVGILGEEHAHGVLGEDVLPEELGDLPGVHLRKTRGAVEHVGKCLGADLGVGHQERGVSGTKVPPPKGGMLRNRPFSFSTPP